MRLSPTGLWILYRAFGGGNRSRGCNDRRCDLHWTRGQLLEPWNAGENFTYQTIILLYYVCVDMYPIGIGLDRGCSISLSIVHSVLHTCDLGSFPRDVALKFKAPNVDNEEVSERC